VILCFVFRCKICHHELLFSGSSVGCHVIAAHKMSFIEYKSQYLQFRERRKRSASGVDGEHNESGHNRRSGGSSGGSKTRWCAQWYNGASYACTVCPFRTHVRTRMTKHVRAEHPERLGTKRTGATDGVFETTFGRFKCEYCGEEICHNKTEIVRHLECHSMDLETYRRLYLPSSSVVVTAAGGSGEAVIIARRKPSASQKSTSTTQAIVSYESTTTTSSSSDQRNRRSDEDVGNGDHDQSVPGGLNSIGAHQMIMERGENGSLMAGWHAMEGRVGVITSGGSLNHHRSQQPPLPTAGGYSTEALVPLGGWKIERPPSVEGPEGPLEDTDQGLAEEERPHHMMNWKLASMEAALRSHHLPPHSTILLASALEPTANSDVVSGHPPPSSLQQLMSDNEGLRNDDDNGPHHHHHHHHQQQLEEVSHQMSSNSGGLHHHREPEGLGDGFGGGEPAVGSEAVENEGHCPPAGEMERFRCPFPDCSFWTDYNVRITLPMELFF
jgi:hypothetical protein